MKIQELLREGYKILKPINEETYMVDCQLLLQYVLNKDKLFIITNKDFDVDNDRCDAYFQLVKFRSKRMPIKYLLKQCEFMGFDFYVREGVLIPRPDTEVLVEQVINEVSLHGYQKVCDVCCGSGIIGISIAKLIMGISVECCDISTDAAEVTAENIKRLGASDRVKFTKSDLLSYAIEAGYKFDVVVSNPPYVREDVIPTLMEDVKNYEPYIALSGGEDGLRFYRAITEQSKKVLNNGGLLAYEIGHDQGEAVVSILESSSFVDVKCIKDYAGNDRVVMGKLRV
ncbi:MAG: peptide chain release factor N(5)-glutamine methyltransferase [Bacillota bacterium]|nr:peptide chain release factor N(5)-glutamine methyltransferase [Bacillota bacterium]